MLKNRNPTTAVFISLLCAFAQFSLLAHAAVAPMAPGAVVGQSDEIFVGEVVAKRSMRNAQNFIVTRYDIMVSDTLLGEEEHMKSVTLAGGQVGDEEYRVSGIPEFDVSDQLLLMLTHADYPTFSAITGLHRGAFTATDGAAGQSAQVVDSNGRRMANAESGENYGFGEFVEKVRAMIPTNKATAAAAHQALPAEVRSQLLGPLPALRYLPGRSPNAASQRGGDLSVAPAPALLPAPPSRVPTGGATGAAEQERSGAQFDGEISSAYAIFRHVATPVVFNPLPDHFFGAGVDTDQMAYWNRYIDDVFRVYADVRDTWAWRNDRSEIAGWQSNEAMIEQFGMGWGANTLAVAWSRWLGDGPVIETDIALNAAKSWTLDAQTAFANDGVHYIPNTFLHELGHALGLDHEFSRLAVMNYPPSRHRAYGRLYADDVQGARTNHPDRVLALTDVGVSLFRASSYQDYFDAQLSDSEVAPGESFTVADFVLQNLGQPNAVELILDWYLTPDRFVWGGAIYIGRTQHGLLSSQSQLTTSALLVAPEAPPGLYQVAAYVRTPGDQLDQNNSAWLDASIRIVEPPSASPVTLDIKVNDQDGPLTLGRNAPLTVDISMAPNGTLNSHDWWIAADLNGQWYHYDFSGWVRGFAVSRTAPPQSLDDQQILNLPGGLGASGQLRLYFYLDTVPDGSYTSASAYGDAVEVNLQ